MRFKVNKGTFSGVKPPISPADHCSSSSSLSDTILSATSHTSAMTLPLSSAGPLKKDGNPDMRYRVNRQLFGESGTNDSLTSQAVQQSCFTSFSPGPLKMDGTPDMRYAANRSVYGSNSSTGFNASGLSEMLCGSSSYCSSSSAPSGPLKSDGTPDMRYKVNWH